MVFTGQSSLAVPAALAMPAAALTNHLDLSVVDSSNNSIEITQFKYLINEDNTGTTEQRTPANGCSPSSPSYSGSCNWVSAGSRMAATARSTPRGTRMILTVPPLADWTCPMAVT